MKKRLLFISLLLLFAVEAAAFGAVFFQRQEVPQDTVAVNEVLQSAQTGWRYGTVGGSDVDGSEMNAGNGRNAAHGLDYVVLDLEGAVLYRSGPGFNESINEAIRHRDTILDVKVDGRIVGKLIVYNDSADAFREDKKRTLLFLAGSTLGLCLVCSGYFFWLERTVLRPFQKLKRFAEYVAGGNLDIPLEMDRNNLFGAFTESFDLMRSELKRARLAKAKADAEKKELIAKLSHDIKTPVASIKAAAEVGGALVEKNRFSDEMCWKGRERLQENYKQIVQKADQIDALITNLFTATLEELSRLSVTPKDMENRELSVILENADYMRCARISDIPECLLYADRLRLQQVFDNLFANAYKYALGTPKDRASSGAERQHLKEGVHLGIEVTAEREFDFLTVIVEDFGGGVGEEELPLLKEKFKRGKNAENRSGAGLGLYISDYFMKEMGGELAVENGRLGLKVSVKIPLSGRCVHETADMFMK
ncbi:MAG: HAMP domain-containing histidine kinase [Lachnospiraceae bacterium]|nr:HAMP domain-containing histidine kinase [Lachnospiraceae bacterium]